MAMTRIRWRSRPVRLSRKQIWFISFLVMIFFTFQTFIYVEKNIKPYLLNLATFRIKQMATESINSTISETISRSRHYDQLVEWKTDASGRISGLSLNYAQHMQIVAEAIEHVESLLVELSSKPEKIPLGMALGSTLLGSMGPDIAVTFRPIGHARIDLKTRETDAGINMVLVEVYMQIHAELMIIVPFGTQPEVVTSEVPISYVLVVGDVPMYYFDNKGNPTGPGQVNGIPNIALPVVPDEDRE
jgi:sporulation protein YunB